MKRAIIVVLDSVGIGELPDAKDFGDVGSNTLVNIKKARPQTDLKNLCALGLGNIQGEEIHLLGKTDSPKGAYGKMAEKSIGKDTTTGHWEIAGIITAKPFPTFTETGFPKEVMDAFEQSIGTKTLGNYAASGTEIIKDLGPEHVKTGYPIVYTSADSVFQIAAHEEVISVEKLYEMCQKAREILSGDYGVARVIARPFVGEEGNYIRTKNRKDFSLEPTGITLLDLAKEKGLNVTAIGKIEDIFEHRGITRTDHTTNNNDGIDKTIFYTKEDFEGILFTNLVDTDMIYGHRNDVEGYATALEYFDSKLPEIIAEMKEEDILFITADHGCDPTTPSTDHSREYVPLLVYGKNVKPGIDLGVRKSFADLGQTISDYLGLNANFDADSFLDDILK
ncbi:phosphopentomutase [Anaerotignum sp.]|uniref:phosphopentomutase n=1 Tax=Anaerotignum sp. TaxID=2039241 RepID=UPI003328F885